MKYSILWEKFYIVNSECHSLQTWGWVKILLCQFDLRLVNRWHKSQDTQNKWWIDAYTNCPTVHLRGSNKNWVTISQLVPSLHHGNNINSNSWKCLQISQGWQQNALCDIICSTLWDMGSNRQTKMLEVWKYWEKTNTASWTSQYLTARPIVSCSNNVTSPLFTTFQQCVQVIWAYLQSCKRLRPIGMPSPLNELCLWLPFGVLTKSLN